MTTNSLSTSEFYERFGASHASNRTISHLKCYKFSLVIGLSLIFLANIIDVGMINFAHAQNANLSLSWDSGQDTPIVSMDGTSMYDDRTGKLEYSKSGFYEAIATTYRNGVKIRNNVRDSIGARRNQNHTDFDVGKDDFEHGHWEFRNFIECQNDNTRYCANVTFVADDDAIEELAGATIVNTLELQYVVRERRGSSDFYVDTGASISLSATIQGQSQVNLTWDQGSSGEITWENNGTYPDLTGHIHRYDKVGIAQTSIGTSEIEDTTPTTGDVATTPTTINNFEATAYGLNLSHGTWYVAADFSQFLFRPNATAINDFEKGDVITSKLTISITPTDGSNASATGSIEVEIGRKIIFTLTLDTGDEKIITDGSSSTYPERRGTINIMEGVASTNFDIEASASQKLSTATQETTANPLASSNEVGYKIVGSEGALSYGDWYVKEDNMKFFFRPNATNINGNNGIEFGQTYVSALTLSYVIHDGSGGSRKTVAEATIILEITRQLQFDVSFSSNGRDELVINSGSTLETQYAAIGTIMNPPMGATSRTEIIQEQKNNGSKITYALKAGDPRSERNSGFLVSTHASGHGEWDSKDTNASKHEYFFIPNVSRINALSSNDVVVITVVIAVCNGACEGQGINTEEVTLIRKTLTVRIFGSGAQTVDLTWDSDFGGTVTKAADSANYGDRTGTISTFKITSIHRFEIEITESKAGTEDIVVTSGRASLEANYLATHYERNLVYGTWFFANDNKRFLFRPNSDAINNLNPGESVTSTMSISVFDEVGMRNVFNAPKTISYTIQAPQTALSWNSNTTGTVVVDSSASSYNDLEGTVTSKFLPAMQIFNISITEEKNGSDTVVVNTISENNVLRTYNHYEGKLVYGTWYFATNNSSFLFRPNPAMYDELGENDIVTSVLNITVYNATTGVEVFSEPVSITATIAGQLQPPKISISSPADSVVAGSKVSFTVESDRNLAEDEVLDVNLSISKASELLIWRIPNSVRLDQNNREMMFTLQTKKFFIASNIPKELTVTIESGESYQPSNEKDLVSATVPINKTGEPDEEDDSRVSVAQAAVNALLALQGTNSPPESSGTNPPPPIITIYAITEEIQEGEIAIFQLDTSIVSHRETVIHLVIEPNEKVSIPLHQTVSLSAHQHSTNFRIATLNDNIAGEDSTLNVTIVNGTGYEVASKYSAHATISDSEDREHVRLSQINAVNESILSNLIERTSSNSLELISNRINYLASGGTGTKFQLGNNGITEFMESSNAILFENETLRASALGESSFTMELFPETGTVNRTGLWGQGNFQTIKQNVGGFNSHWHGDMYSFTLGSDYKVNDSILTGFAYSYSDSLVDFNLDQGDLLHHQTEFFGISPYWGWHSPTQQSQIHIISSINQGLSLIEHDDYETVTYDNFLYYLGLSGNSNFWSIQNDIMSNPIQISLDGNVWLARLYSESINLDFPATKLNSNQLKFAVVGEHQLDFSDSVITNQELRLGYHSRQNNIESITGVFVEGSFGIKNTSGFIMSSTSQINNNKNDAKNVGSERKLRI